MTELSFLVELTL